MLKDFVVLGSFATASYAWLSAIVAPLAAAVRVAITERASRRGCAAVALAAGGAILWTLTPLGVALLGMILEPRAGMVVIQTKWWLIGAALGICAWMLHLGIERRIPRISPTFEAA